MVLPTDEIYKERVAAQKAAKEMDIPDEAIMEMKGIVLDLINPYSVGSIDPIIHKPFVRKEKNISIFNITIIVLLNISAIFALFIFHHSSIFSQLWFA